MRKVIFLDIDGVLSPRWWNSDKQSDNYGCLFDAKAVANLAKIIEETAHDMIFDAYHHFDREYRQNKLEEAKKLVKEKV